MKKKLFLGILGLFVFTVCLVRVNAANRIMNVEWELPAVAPSSQPDSSKTYYGTVTNIFDFSNVVFSDINGNDLPGKINLDKIIIGENKNITSNPTGTITKDNLNSILNNYFTAYCLNESRKYPEYGLFNLSEYYQGIIHNGTAADGGYDESSSDPSQLALAIVLANIMNDDKFKPLIDDMATQFGNLAWVNPVNPASGLATELVIPNAGETGHENENMDNYFHYIMGDSGYSSFTVGFRFVGFEEWDSNLNVVKTVYYVADQNTYDEFTSNFAGDSSVVVRYIMGRATTEEYVPITGTLASLALQRYTFTRSVDAKYTHALWIVENSYPTLSLDMALSKAGVNIDTYKAQVKSLYSLADANVDKYTEMVTYGIIQYAIWNVIGETVDDVKLGNSIKGEERSELNKLYQYLINSSNVPNGYANPSVFSDKLTVTAPAKGKELATKDANYDYYGPFKASYYAINEQGSKIQYTIENNENKNIKIVDATHNELTELENKQEFYIQVSNKVELKNVKVNLSISGITTFSPSTNRAVIFNPIAAISQNVLIGGKTSTMSLTAKIDMSVVNNPKTGIQNVALLLLVTLVAFTLGYVVLTFRQKSIQI